MLEVNCREIFSSLQSETIYEKKKAALYIYGEYFNENRKILRKKNIKIFSLDFCIKSFYMKEKKKNPTQSPLFKK